MKKPKEYAYIEYIAPRHVGRVTPLATRITLKKATSIVLGPCGQERGYYAKIKHDYLYLSQ